VEQGAHSVGWRKPYAISFRMGDWKLRREWVAVPSDKEASQTRD
jgi:hypothetical protein